MGKVRDYNIEALRCCLMALIVLGHVATGLNVGDANVRRLINATQAFSVDSFILISGWYGVRFSWMKVLKLCGLGLFASLVLFLLSPLTTYPWRFEYSLGWFGNSYLGLLFVATFINAGINGLRNESERALVAAWGLYATLMFVGWFPLFHGVCGGGGVNVQPPGMSGHSLNQLCFMYITGRVMRLCNADKKVTMRMLIIGFLAMMLINLAWAMLTGLTRGREIWQAILKGGRGYSSPIIILLGICAFLLFKKICVPMWAGRIFAFCAPSMFTVYLLHEATNRTVSSALYNQYLGFGHLAGVWRGSLSVILSAASVFLIATLLDLIRRGILKWTTEH